MKRLLFLSSIAFLFFAFITLLKPSELYAQEACTGDSGSPGECTAPMACPPANIDGQGSCSDPLQICCRNSAPGDGGSGQCGDVCSDSTDCADSPVNLQCPNGVCSDINACPTCIGQDSGWAGVCLPGPECSAAGKTEENDGAGVCTGGDVCCTNAPEGSCTLTAIPPFLVGAVFTVVLTSDTPNETYSVTASPVCGGVGTKTTDASGGATWTNNCGPPEGTYTITATQQGGSGTTCSVDVTVLNAPGPGCTGLSGEPGFCVVLFCPIGMVPNGGYPDQCPTDPEQICCVPLPPGGGAPENPLGQGGCPPDSLYTAIGCIPIVEQNSFIGFLLRWAIGIAGGIAIILIIYAGIMVLTSAGNPQRLQAGKELLTAAVMGLILLLFGAFILNLIGVQILKIPGFGA